MKLQTRLVQLVEDLKEANIDVTLDILRLRVGTNITRFMEKGIATSDAVLWIGTPGLKSRIKFNVDGMADNPATEEFVHIKEKAARHNDCIYSLWFMGDKLDDSYPSHELTMRNSDFRDEREYYRLVPQLAATILKVTHMEEYNSQQAQYNAEINALEATLTASAITKRLEQGSKEDEQRRVATEVKLQALISGMPEHYKEQQTAADEAYLQSLNAKLLKARSKALAPDTPHAQMLNYYIPLRGGRRVDSMEADQFEVSARVQDFVAAEGGAKMLLVLGAMGSGKSLYARLLERQFWQSEASIDIATYSSTGKLPLHP